MEDHMKRFATVVAFTFALSGAALADACSDLVDQAQAGLGMSDVDETTRTQLQQLLETGKTGDVSRCEAAITATIPQSSPAGGPGGHSCSKSPDTV
jgi:hypothetical protein